MGDRQKRNTEHRRLRADDHARSTAGVGPRVVIAPITDVSVRIPLLTGVPGMCRYRSCWMHAANQRPYPVMFARALSGEPADVQNYLEAHGTGTLGMSAHAVTP
jgi:hypothetical protein